MSEDNIKTKYCLDSSALLELRSLDKDVFKGIWDVLDELVEKDIVHAPREVFREVTRFDSTTAAWAKTRQRMFFTPNQELMDMVVKVQEKFKFFDPDFDWPKADPFLVAHATLKGCKVVTQETPKKKDGQVKIPDACKHFGAEVINLSEFFREQGWTFIGKKIGT
jgi:hypothetical protein